MYRQFYLIEPDLLDPEDTRQLIRALNADFSGTKLRDVVGLAREGRAQLWRFEADDSRGIVVTQIIEIPCQGKELYIWLLAGNNLLKQLRHIDARLADYARIHHCRRLRAEAVPQLARIYQRRQGYLTHSICLIKPVAEPGDAYLGVPPSFAADEIRLPLGGRAYGDRFRLWIPTRAGGTLRVDTATAQPLLGEEKWPQGIIIRLDSRQLEIMIPPGLGPAWVTFKTTVSTECKAAFRQTARAWNREPDDPLIPWDFWDWPYSASTPWPARAVRTMAKYASLFPADHPATQGADWETRHHCSAFARSWEGHCHMGAAASVLFEPPPRRYRDLEQIELQLLAAEFAGNYSRTGQRWHLCRGRKPLPQLRFYPPAYFKPDLLDVSEKAVRFALTEEVEPRGLAAAAESMIQANGGTECFAARLPRWFGELAGEFYSFLLEHLLGHGHPLLCNVRAYEPDAGPGGIHNQAIYRYEASYREQSEAAAQADEEDRFNMDIEAKVFTNDSESVDGGPVIYNYLWKLRFGNDGRIQIDHPSNRWISLRNEEGQAIYAPTDLVVLEPLSPGNEARREGADGNPAITWELLERIPVLRLRERYLPSSYTR